MPWYDYSSAFTGPPRPVLEVVLWHGSSRVRLPALVDSGADSSLIDIAYAKVLGLKQKDRERVGSVGAGGTEFLTWRWPNIEVQFGNDRFAFEGTFVEFTDDAEPMNLLGRKDFFNRYIISFWDAAEMFNVDLSPDHPQPAVSLPGGTTSPLSPRVARRQPTVRE